MSQQPSPRRTRSGDCQVQSNSPPRLVKFSVSDIRVIEQWAKSASAPLMQEPHVMLLARVAVVRVNHSSGTNGTLYLLVC
jgi:hypothetical protein